MALLWILGALFLALIVIIPLVEKFGPRLSGPELAKISRFIFPLMAVLIILQLLRMLL